MSRSAVEFRSPTPADIVALAAGLRPQDRAELDACGYTDHLATIADSVKASQWCRAVLVGGELAAIVGLARGGTLMAPVGVPWMLGTALVRRHRCTLARLAPRYIRAMLQEYPTLTNYVHARNTVAVQWLQRIGFTLAPPAEMGPVGEMFHKFEMRG